MIEADERGGLGHSVALNNRVAHALEEVLGFIRKRRAAGDERPELPAKPAVDSTKHPGAPDFGRIAGRFENDRRPKEWRDEQRHKLPEDVAQWNECDEPQRVKPALVFAIRINAALEWLKVRQEIAVRQNNHP